MDALTNPYSPGAGARPPALVGRDNELETWTIALGRAATEKSTRSLALYGLRGVGKTVLLTEMASNAEREGWIVGQLEAAAGATLRAALSAVLQSHVARLARRTKGKKMLSALKTALSFSATVEADGSTTFGPNLGAMAATATRALVPPISRSGSDGPASSSALLARSSPTKASCMRPNMARSRSPSLAWRRSSTDSTDSSLHQRSVPAIWPRRISSTKARNAVAQREHICQDAVMDLTWLAWVAAVIAAGATIGLYFTAMSQAIRSLRFSEIERLAWVAGILLVPVFGVVAWFLFGRERAVSLR